MLILLVVMFGCNRQANQNATNMPPDAIGFVNNRKLSLKVYDWKLKSGAEVLGVDPAASAGNQDFEELREGIVSNMIDGALIAEETERRGLTATNEKLQMAEQKEIDKIGSPQDYENFLKKYSLTKDDYREILKTNLLEEMLREDLTKDIQISDKEVEDYYKEHGKEILISEESKKQPTLAEAKPVIIQTLKTGRAKQALTDWLKEARKKAKVQLGENYRFGKLKSEFPN